MTDRLRSEPSEGALWRPAVSVAWILLVCNVVFVAGVPRVVALTLQRDARDYGRIAAGVKTVISPGSVVWGDPKGWYAVIGAGATLRIPSLFMNDAPDPGRDAYAIVNNAECPAGYESRLYMPQPLPRIMGRAFSSDEYDLRICARPAARGHDQSTRSP